MTITFNELRTIIEEAAAHDKLSDWELTFVFGGSWPGALSEKQALIANRILSKVNAPEAVALDASRLFALADNAIARGAKRISFKLSPTACLKFNAKYDNFVVFRGTWPDSQRVLTLKRDGSINSSDNVLIETVSELARDPLSFAIGFGRLTSSCMFCSRALDTKESVGAGYGPICAANYGLPWGDTSRYEALKADLTASFETAAQEPQAELTDIMAGFALA